ncbi:MAG TPA: dual specificity protein phosphatase [Polyangiaceae bacterium]|nr:dual specificity protein phosphatase [Polyangiaceae bacterium]
MIPKPSHDHQWVTDRIALGSAVTRGEQVRVLLDEHVTHVLDLRLHVSSPELVLYEKTGIELLRAGVLDDHLPKPDEWFHRGIDFVLGALDRRRSRVLIHCLAGVSRAPSMTYAVLRALGTPGADAEAKIRKARALVQRIRYRDDADRALRSWRRRR